MHQKPGFGPQISKKSPQSPSVASLTQLKKLPLFPPPPLPMNDKNALPKQIRLSGKDERFGQNKFCPQTETVQYAYAHYVDHKGLFQPIWPKLTIVTRSQMSPPPNILNVDNKSSDTMHILVK